MLDVIRSEPLAVFVLIGFGAGLISYVLALLYGATHEPRVLCDQDFPADDGTPADLWLPTSKGDEK